MADNRHDPDALATPHGGESNFDLRVNDPHDSAAQNSEGVSAPSLAIPHTSDSVSGGLLASRYRGLPVVFLVRPSGSTEPCPYLMSAEDVADLFRLHQASTRFPRATLRRYRKQGLKTVRAGRRVWYALPDVLDFLDSQQLRPTG